MKKLAFTISEAILVMAILGVIAAIMIATIRPADYKEKGLLLKAEKTLNAIDTATLRIMTDHSGMGNMTTLFDENGGFEFRDDAERVLKLYKKYLAIKNKAVDSGSFCTTEGRTGTYLKDGGCIGIKAGEGTENTIFPKEESIESTTATQGFIYFDVNDKEEPNTIGKDEFILPIGDEGIENGSGAEDEENKACPSPILGAEIREPYNIKCCIEYSNDGCSCTKCEYNGVISASSQQYTDGYLDCGIIIGCGYY